MPEQSIGLHLWPDANRVGGAEGDVACLDAVPTPVAIEALH
jgi:hypothetical protein